MREGRARARAGGLSDVVSVELGEDGVEGVGFGDSAGVDDLCSLRGLVIELERR